MSRLRPETVAVVVTYEPDVDRLAALLRALAHQVEAVVIVDNASATDPAGVLDECCPLLLRAAIRLDRNYGIATAQNTGIDWARRQGARQVLLMDQDSLPEPDMVEALKQAAASLPAVAAVGPNYRDPRQDQPAPFIRVRGLRLERRWADAAHCLVEADYLIASGCLIPLAAIDRVGPMRDDLFIDYVDIEWGLRARRAGLRSYGVFEARMTHALGEDPRRLFGRPVPVHSPLRHYYLMRNAILLYRERWVPINWKLVDAWRLLLKFGFYALLTRPRLQHARMMTLGLWHGLIGRTGPLA